MKILLVGEYSRLHNSLKEGLVALGHEVTIVGTGDRFKNFPVDFSIAPQYFSGSLSGLFRKALDYLFGINLLQIARYKSLVPLMPKFQGYDVVQLINSNAFEIEPSKQIKIYRQLFAQNRKCFLLVCGDETPVIDELLKGSLRYSILTPMLDDNRLRKYYGYSLKYVIEKYRNLYDFVEMHSEKILVSDLDYKIPMEQQGIPVAFIPNPINTDKIKFTDNVVSGKIVIFLGVNTLSAIKKGTSFFVEALEIIEERFRDRVEIIRSENLPYDQYITLYNRSHIVLDQVYSYDQGYNALEAMAKGKVVFTGAEIEFTRYYGLTERVNVNALPDVNQIVAELSNLIQNPEEILIIGKRARTFIEKEHHYIKIAQQYLEVWQ